MLFFPAAGSATAASSSAATAGSGTFLGMGPLGWGIGLGLAAFGSTILGGMFQNDAVDDYNEQIAESVGIQQVQLTDQAGLDIDQTMDTAQAYRSHLRVAAAESGMGIAGTYKALLNNINFDEEKNIDIIKQNLKINIAAVRSQGESSMQTGTPGFLTGLNAGLTGLTTGLSVYGAGQSIGLANKQLASLS